MQENIIYFSIAAFSVFALSAAGTRTVIAVMKRNHILQNVNNRSLHSIPTPVGGGWAVLLSALLVWMLAQGQIDEQTAVLIVSTASLLLLSWIDDIKPLPAFSRLGMQFVAVSGSLYLLPQDTHIISNYLPVILDRIISAICWLWFINLFNFMDGMDGLAGTETIVIGLGIILVGSFVDLSQADLLLALLLTAAMAGFLIWNWSPARIFLGDVGSIPIGFLLGWLLIQLAINGALLAALILPLYFLFDASLTITRRLLKGEKIWEAHRQHLYQKAALSGLTHSQVVLRILPSNILLIYSSIISLTQPLLGIALAASSIFLLVTGLFFLKEGP